MIRPLSLALLLTSCTPRTVEPLAAPSALRSVRSVPLASPAAAIDLDPAPNVLRAAFTAAQLEQATAEGFRYAYNGQVPGPTLRAKVGDTLVVQLTNNLSTPTTLHWHGLHVPIEMDGIPTEAGRVAAGGGTFEYRFTLTHAGTFWYHPHFDTARQVDLGLYGALIVEDPAEPSVEHDIVALLDNPDEQLGEGPRPGHGHGRMVRDWLVNGVRQPVLNAAPGDRVRLRLINVADAGIVDLRGDDLSVIAFDQGLLAAERRTNQVVLAPGDRAEVAWTLDAQPVALNSAPYSLNGGPALGPEAALLRLDPNGLAHPPEPLFWPFPGGRPSLDPGHTEALFAFTGSDRTGRWRINGEAYPNITIQRVALDQPAILDVRNLSPTEHPFHLHGMPFEVLSINGVAPTHKRIEDTLLLRIRDRARLLILADNPGDWMAHCHILPHAEDGMMTVLRVE
jgi:FtsP/CotA-like multicopper oxidase with cupredoxin domain